jgi:protein gp37
MADGSAIEWTDATWNPVTGCTKISRGCDHCYAERFAERFRGVADHPFSMGFDLALRPERLSQPMGWRRPRMIFVNSMSDLFHKEVPRAFIDRVFDTMESAHWHIFQVLTKRSSLMLDYLRNRYSEGHGPPHIWCGVSIEDAQTKNRLEHLRAAPAAIRFLSVEPLLGPLGDLKLAGIDWVIVGGESGPGARVLHPDWVREVRDHCKSQGIAFFFKQWGGLRAKSGGRELDGREWNEFPADLSGRLTAAAE